jgi:hypothetical protein
MRTADDIVNEAVSVFVLVQELVKTDREWSEPGQMIRSYSSTMLEQHRHLLQDVVEAIEEWGQHVKEARADGTLPPSAAQASK